jgi:hypothetical protein
MISQVLADLQQYISNTSLQGESSRESPVRNILPAGERRSSGYRTRKKVGYSVLLVVRSSINIAEASS